MLTPKKSGRAPVAPVARFAAVLAIGVLVAAALSAVALVGVGTTAPAGASIAASWNNNGSPNSTCDSYSYAVPPVGTTSASVTLAAGGGGSGGGGGNDSNPTGGAGGEYTGATLSWTTSTGDLYVLTGCGGSGGSQDSSSVYGVGGGGAGSGGNGGGDGASYDDRLDSGGGGGGGSELCVGSTSCSTLVMLTGGGGGGGGAPNSYCSSGGGSGNGGNGNDQGGTSSDGSDGGGGGAPSGDSGGGGGSGYASDGSGGGTGAPANGGAGANYSDGSDDCIGEGGGGGGGYGGGGGGGADDSYFDDDDNGGGGGGGSNDWFNTAYGSTPTLTTAGNGGSSTTTNCTGSHCAGGGQGSVSLSWNGSAPAKPTMSGATTVTQGAGVSDSFAVGSASSYAISGSVPGLALNTSSGAFTGTPSTTGTYSISVTASNPYGTSAADSVTFTVNPSVTVTNPGNQSGVTGTAVNLQLSASDASGHTISNWSATGMPAGLAVNSAGLVTGTPTTAGVSTVTVTATDSGSYTGSATFTWTLTNTVTVTAPGAQTSNAGSAVTNVTVSAKDSSSTTSISTWSLSGAPPGLSISTSGVISGTPTTGGSYSVTVTAKDAAGYSGTSAAFSWTVDDVVTVTNPGSQSSTSGTAISTLTPSASVVGGGTVSSWSAAGLPPGLSINATSGAMTGTPTVAGSFSVTLTATDSRGAQGEATFTWTVINTVTVANPGSQTSTPGVAIAALQIHATDSSSSATLTYAITGEPTGLSINSTSGSISGTPSTAGSFSVTVTATDQSGAHGQATFSWTVTGSLTVTNPGNQSSVSGTAITPLQIAASDASPTAILSYSATGLPPGLGIDPSSGQITGTPTTAGTYSPSVTATDNYGDSGQTSFSWTITNVVTVANPGTQSSVSGSAIAGLAASATDSSSAATITGWAASGLPPGLSVDPASGKITGTPTTGGTYSVTLTATDSAGYFGQASFTWDVTNVVSVSNPGDQSSVSGSAISPLQIAAADSSPTATLSYSATGLPAGLSIGASTGQINGTPTTAGTSSVTVTVTDSAGFTGQAGFTWTVTNVVSVTNPGSQDSVSGTAIASLQIEATDSSSTATLSFSAAGLPNGLSISTSGLISGTPSVAGVYSVTVTATDSAGFSAQASFSWDIGSTVSVANPGSQSDVSGTAIATVQLSASDSSGGASFTWTATGLPAGLSIGASSGQITGTPTTAGVSSVTVTATDNYSSFGQTTFAWTITNLVTVTSPGTNTGNTGTPTTLQLHATDSSTTATITSWSASNLPTGLSVDATSGLVSGTPTTAGHYTPTVTATDSAGFTGSVKFTWVESNVITITNPGAQSATSGQAFSLQLSATDSSPFASVDNWQASGLPPGLLIDPTSGLVSGTPSGAFSGNVTIEAADSAGYVGVTEFDFTVYNVITVTNPGSQLSPVGQPIQTLQVVATDSAPGATLAYTDSGTLPPGLALGSSSGQVTGTPTTPGVYSVTVTASDASGSSGSATFTWTIGDDVSVTNPGNQYTNEGVALSPGLQLSATDSAPSPTFTWSATGLPTGLSIGAASGTITGTPTADGTTTVTVTAADQTGAQGSATFTWTVGNTVSVANPGTEDATTGTPIATLQISATDTDPSATLSYAASDLPPGLVIDPAAGTITGTADAGGDFPVTVTVTDSDGFSGRTSFSFDVTSVVSVTNPGAQRDLSGSPITPLDSSATDSASSATIASWQAAGLPEGLAIDPASGTISGTPTTAGSFPVTLTATDSQGFSGQTTFTWTIFNTVSVTNPGDQQDVSGTAIAPLSDTAIDSSGIATIAWSASGLPAGLSIAPASGAITGTPTTAGSYQVTLTATDNAGYSGEAGFTWTITNLVSVINPGDQQDVSGSAISDLDSSATTSSSTATITGWQATDLPEGLSIDPVSGTLSGTPDTGGVFSVTLTATDSAGFSGQASFTWTITNIVTVANPGNQESVSGEAITALDNSATDTSSTATIASWQATGLPPGLVVNPITGTITGTPTQGGIFAVTLAATDSAGYSGQAGFDWTTTNTVTVTNPGDQQDVSGSAIAALQIEATDSSSSATLSYTDHSTLPPGLAIDPASGDITGTPTTAGSYPVTITVTDNEGSSGSASFTWTIGTAPSITSADATTMVAGTGSSFSVTATGSPAPALSVTGSLPEGVEFADLGGGAGQLAGAPDAGTVGTYALVVSAISTLGTATQDFTLTVVGAPATSAITSSVDPSSYDHAVILTDTVTGNDTLGAPTGTVGFSDTTGGGDAPIDSCGAAILTPSGTDTATATCSYSPPVSGDLGGDFTVVATSSGDASYASSTSPAFTQVVGGAQYTTINLIFSAKPIAHGQSVTMTATVGDPTGAGVPSGTVDFYDVTGGADTLLCSEPAEPASASTSTASCEDTPVVGETTGGTFSFEDVYSGDFTYGMSVDHQTLEVLGTADSTLSTTSSTSTGQVTKALMLTATVAAAGDGPTPTGSVTFFIGGDPAECSTGSATRPLNASGQATCKWIPSAYGDYPVTFTYSGDTTYQAAGPSATFTQVVGGDIATTASAPVLTAPVPPARPEAGQAVTVATSVSAASGSTPTGSVTFSETEAGTTATLACSPATVDVTGRATCTFVPVAGPLGATVQVSAAYDGSSVDAPSPASAPLVIEVIGSEALSGFAVTSNLDPDPAGALVTFSATVTGTGATPTGTVSFFDNASPITCIASSAAPVKVVASETAGTAAATCREIPPGAGTHTITASYSGDVDYAPATTPSGLDQVASGATAVSTVAVTSPADPSSYGSSVTLAATVTGTTTVPGNWVSFSAKVGTTTTVICAQSPLAPTSGLSAEASCDYDPPAQGGTGQVASITAHYSGDATYAEATSKAFSQIESGEAAPATFTLAASANPLASGQVVVLSATLTAADGQATPTGTVSFFDDAGQISCATTSGGAAKLSAAGVATCKETPADSGTHTITASYSGDVTYAAEAAPSPLALLVDGTTAAAEVAVTSPADPSSYGSSVTLAATVTGTTTVPGGWVNLNAKVGTTTTVICTQAPLAPTSGLSAEASCDYDPPAQGGTGQVVSITATYSGDATYAEATSKALSQIESGEAAPATFTLAASANPLASGKVVVLSATLTAADGQATPTGTVSFFDDAGQISCATTSGGAAKLSAAGVATCKETPADSGTHTITASYSGDVTYAAEAAPSPLALLVDGTTAAAEVAVTSPADPSSYGSSVTLAATVTGTTTVPGNWVSFSAKVGTTTTVICAQSPLAPTTGLSAEASCDYDPTAQGGTGQVASITATYSGDATYAEATSKAFSQQQDGDETLTGFTLGASPNPSPSPGHLVTLTATLTGTGAAPTGTVVFSVDGTPITCTGVGSPGVKVLSTGTATCHYVPPASGTSTVTATYSGDVTYQGIDSSTTGFENSLSLVID